MQARPGISRDAIARLPQENADPRLIAPDGALLARRKIGDGGPGMGGGGLPAIEKEAIQPRAAGEEVGTQAAIEHIIARAAHEGIVTSAAIERVIAGAAIDCIQSAKAGDCVISAGACQAVIAARAKKFDMLA